MFVKITNGQVEKAPYTIGEFRKAHPNKSFPKDIPTDLLEAHGVFAIKESVVPTVDKKTHTYSWKVESVNGVWTQVWSTTQLPEETAANNVRQHRDRLLAATDWRFRSDMNPSQAWVDYCQALRDVPAQAGFPWDVQWPETPQE